MVPVMCGPPSRSGPSQLSVQLQRSLQEELHQVVRVSPSKSDYVGWTRAQHLLCRDCYFDAFEVHAAVVLAKIEPNIVE